MPEKLTIKVKLPTNRDKTGTLELIDPFTGLAIFGPVPVLGRAAKDTATAHGNPTRNPTKSHGHTPLGKYDVQNIVTNGPGTPRTFEVYGGAGSIGGVRDFV